MWFNDALNNHPEEKKSVFHSNYVQCNRDEVYLLLVVLERSIKQTLNLLINPMQLFCFFFQFLSELIDDFVHGTILAFTRSKSTKSIVITPRWKSWHDYSYKTKQNINIEKNHYRCSICFYASLKLFEINSEYKLAIV